jgi:hypothetical protein
MLLATSWHVKDAYPIKKQEAHDSSMGIKKSYMYALDATG